MAAAPSRPFSAHAQFHPRPPSRVQIRRRRRQPLRGPRSCPPRRADVPLRFKDDRLLSSHTTAADAAALHNASKMKIRRFLDLFCPRLISAAGPSGLFVATLELKKMRPFLFAQFAPTLEEAFSLQLRIAASPVHTKGLVLLAFF